jgi:hypothetical protein
MGHRLATLGLPDYAPYMHSVFMRHGGSRLLTLWLASVWLLAASGCAGTQKPAPGTPEALKDDRRCDRAGKKVEEIDLNNDGKPDVWKLYTTIIEGGTSVNVLTCKEIDVNFDGRKDMWEHYDAAGNKELEEFDLDFDGKIDLWVVYQNGKKIREEMDTNFDGKPDLFKYYDNDKLTRIERSSKQNGRIDTWEFYEGGKLDRIGYDTTGAGKPDRWDRAPDDSVPAEATAQAAPAKAPAALPRMESAPTDKAAPDKDKPADAKP